VFELELFQHVNNQQKFSVELWGDDVLDKAKFWYDTMKLNGPVYITIKSDCNCITKAPIQLKILPGNVWCTRRQFHTWTVSI
jgi:hypothetical protein